MELPEEIDSDLSDMTITKSMLEEADTLKVQWYIFASGRFQKN